MQRGVLL
ncbi:hypothetical protein E2C01_089520 [Portunus trituberculatus]|nr:hypothetical protein [Portunus trituberculatus]